MILFFGIRPGKTHSRILLGPECPYCKQINTLTAFSTPSYFHLFWLPVFRISTDLFAECSHCKRAFYKDEFTAEMERAVEKQ